LKSVVDRLERFHSPKGRRNSGGEAQHGHAQAIRGRAIVYVLLSTGLRREELVMLDVGQVSPREPELLREAKRARLTAVIGKGGTTRTVFLSADARTALADYFEHERPRDAFADAPAAFLSAVSVASRRPGGRLSQRSINTILERIGRWHDAEHNWNGAAVIARSATSRATPTLPKRSPPPTWRRCDRRRGLVAASRDRPRRRHRALHARRPRPGVVAQQVRIDAVGFAAMLKFVAWKGRFPRGRFEFPDDAIAHLARQVNVPPVEIGAYDFAGRQIKNHRREIRNRTGFRICSVTDAEALVAWLANEHRAGRAAHRAHPRPAARALQGRVARAAKPERVARIVDSGIHQADAMLAATVVARLKRRHINGIEALIKASVDLDVEETTGIGEPEPEEDALSAVKASPGNVSLATMFAEMRKLQNRPPDRPAGRSVRRDRRERRRRMAGPRRGRVAQSSRAPRPAGAAGSPRGAAASA